MWVGASSLCVFYGDVDGSGFVHGVDFVIVTRQWHAKEIEKHLRSKWDVEVQTFGPGDDDGKHVAILNRVLTWGPNGIGHEADQEHAAKLVKRNLTTKDRPISTPGENMNDNVNESELSAPEEIKSIRTDAARQLLRPNLQFSGKGISRAMSKLTKKDQRNRKHGDFLEES